MFRSSYTHGHTRILKVILDGYVDDIMTYEMRSL